MADRRETLRRYVAQFISDRAEQDAIIDAAVARSKDPEDDRWHAREEIAWRAVEAMRGDPAQTNATFELLHRLYHPQILGRIRGGIRGHADAEYLAQTAFSRLFEGRDRLDPQEGWIGGLVTKIADNLVADWWKERGPCTDAPRPATPRQPEPAAQGREQVGVFLRNLVRLGPPHQAVAVLLIHFLEWRPAEVVREWSHRRLREAASWAERECRTVGIAQQGMLDAAFQTLREKLQNPVHGSNAAEDRERLGAVWDVPAGEVILAAYCGSDPSANVANWNHRLGKHVRVAKQQECPEFFDREQ